MNKNKVYQANMRIAAETTVNKACSYVPKRDEKMWDITTFCRKRHREGGLPLNICKSAVTCGSNRKYCPWRYMFFFLFSHKRNLLYHNASTVLAL